MISLNSFDEGNKPFEERIVRLSHDCPTSVTELMVAAATHTSWQSLTNGTFTHLFVFDRNERRRESCVPILG